MAEKVELFELNINVGQATKDLAESQKNVKALKDQIKELQKAEGDNSIAIADATAKLKAEQKELSTNTNLTKNLVVAKKAEKGSLDQVKAQLAVTSIQWSRLSKEERLNEDTGKKLTAQKTKLTEQLKKEERATGDARRNVGNYSEAINGAVGGLSRFVPGLSTASNAMKAFGVATKFALGPIALLIAAGVALKEFFTSSEEGQNKLNKIMAVFSTILGNLSDVLSDVGESIFETFSNPKQAIEDFAESFKENIVNRFVGLIELIPALGKAVSLLFKGEFKEAGKVATDAVAKVTLGVEDFSDKATDAFEKTTEAAKEFAAEMEREIAIAKRLADLQASLDKTIRSNLVENAKLASEIAEIRAKASEKDKLTSEERLALLDEALKKENEILDNNLKVAQTQFDIKVAQNALSKSNKADLDEQAQLEANLFNVKKANFERLKSLERERQTAIKETQALEAKQAADETKRLADVATAEAKQLSDRIKLRDEYFAKETQRRLTNEANELALQQDNIFNQLDVERAGLEAKQEQEIAFAESIGADTTLIEQKYANAREAINQAENQAKIALATDFLGNIAQIAGEGTGIGKAAAVAQATISTFQGATSAFAALAPIPIVGPALGITAAAAAITAGFQNVKNILKVDSGLPGDNAKGGGGASGGGGGRTPIAPNVNQGIVSRDNINNGNTEDIVVQPTLMTDSVTEAQKQQTANNKTAVI